MSQESRASILGSLDVKSRVIGLVTLVVEATYLASIAVLKGSDILWALVVSAVVFITVIVSIVVLESRAMKTNVPIRPSPLTPEDPLLTSIISSAMETVCRGVAIPNTPEAAKLRAFIFKFEKEENALVCTHYWAPESLIVEEEVGLRFELKSDLINTIAVVKSYFDRKPTRTPVQQIREGLGACPSNRSAMLRRSQKSRSPTLSTGITRTHS